MIGYKEAHARTHTQTNSTTHPVKPMRPGIKIQEHQAKKLTGPAQQQIQLPV